MQKIGIGYLILFLRLRIVFHPSSILCPGRNILVKLSFHTAVHVVGQAPGFFRLFLIRPGLPFVMCKIIRKREPIHRLISKIGLCGLCGLFGLGSGKSRINLVLVCLNSCHIKVVGIACGVYNLKITGICFEKRNFKSVFVCVIFEIGIAGYKIPCIIICA